MDLQGHKITDAERQTLGVTALADRPEMPAQNLKEHFDALTNKVADKFNATVDDLQHIENDYEQWDTDEQGRKTAEIARVTAEAARVTAEDMRATTEAARSAAENMRTEAETDRAAAEVARSATETGRVNAETARVTAEEVREAAEATRSAAETARNVWEAYDPTKNYVPGNKVTFKGSSYVNILQCMGTPPTEIRYWILIAQRGQDGDGVGDMMMHTYDPTDKKQDIFAYARSTTASTVTAHNTDAGAHQEIQDRIANNLALCATTTDVANLATSLSNKAANSLGFAGQDLLAWADTQAFGGAFMASNDTTINHPIPGWWLHGLLTVSNATSRMIFVVEPYSGRTFIARTDAGGWAPWVEVYTANSKPYVSGMYVGDGQAQRHIDLGFTPKMVFILCAGYVTSDNWDVRGGMAFPEIPIRNDTWEDSPIAIEIVDGGFNVSKIGTATATNEEAKKYTYLAEK